MRYSNMLNNLIKEELRLHQNSIRELNKSYKITPKNYGIMIQGKRRKKKK